MSALVSGLKWMSVSLLNAKWKRETRQTVPKLPAQYDDVINICWM